MTAVKATNGTISAPSAAIAILLWANLGWASEPLREPTVPCDAAASKALAIDLQPHQVASSLAMASGVPGTDEPSAIAVEIVDTLSGTSTVQIRFAPPPGSTSMSKQWSWTVDATAVLGPGTGPSLARLPGQVPTWLVLMARPDPTGSRPVASTVSLDADSRRLELDNLVLDPAQHVFGPRVLTTPAGVLLSWGESGVTFDTIVTLPWPAPLGAEPKMVAKGRFADTIACTGFGPGGIVAWVAQDTTATSPGWSLEAALITASGEILEGPAQLSSFERQPLIAGIGTDKEIVSIHLLALDPVSSHPVTVTTGPTLAEKGTTHIERPAIDPGSTSAAGILPGGKLALAWTAGGDDSRRIDAWTAGGVWVGSAGPTGPPLAMVVDADGLLLAWSEEDASRVVVASVQLADEDSDTVPDMVDLCPTLPETPDGTLDTDGCPDPHGATDSPWDTGDYWFSIGEDLDACLDLRTVASNGSASLFLGTTRPGRSTIVGPDGSTSTVSDLGGPVTDALALPGGAWLVAAQAKLYRIDPDLLVEEIHLDTGVPDEVPEVRKLEQLTDSTIVVVSGAGAAVVSQSNLALVRWLSEGVGLVDASADSDGKLYLLTEKGKVLSYASPSSAPIAIAAPKVASGDRPVGLASASGAIHVAWSDSGVYTRQVSGTKFVKLPAAGLNKPPSTGARSIAGLGSGAVAWVDAQGRPWVLTGDGWRLLTVGAEGMWVRSVHADNATNRLMILGSDGRARVMALLEQVSTVEVGAEHFVKSGAKLNKSGEALLAPLVSKLTSSGLVVRIEGHTDSSGVAASNLLLSLKRARAAASWLMQQGVEPASIQVVGYGEMFPVDDPSSLANRRVILRLLSP